MANYFEQGDKIAKDIRDELSARIQEAITKNQECFVAEWFKKNPDVDPFDYVLVHGFKDDQYTFSIERKEK